MPPGGAHDPVVRLLLGLLRRAIPLELCVERPEVAQEAARVVRGGAQPAAEEQRGARSRQRHERVVGTRGGERILARVATLARALHARPPHAPCQQRKRVLPVQRQRLARATKDLGSGRLAR